MTVPNRPYRNFRAAISAARVHELRTFRPSPDFEALKLRKGRSGRTIRLHVNRRIKTNNNKGNINNSNPAIMGYLSERAGRLDFLSTACS